MLLACLENIVGNLYAYTFLYDLILFENSENEEMCYYKIEYDICGGF